MESGDWVLLIWMALGGFLLGQNSASGNIGVRPRSVWYQTHFLLKKRGICSLIYFKPKHFGRFTLYEVASFFGSYLTVLAMALVGLARQKEWISDMGMTVFALSLMGVHMFAILFITILNDVGSHRDEKKRFYPESGERQVAPLTKEDFPKQDRLAYKVLLEYTRLRNNSYYTVYNLRDSYHAKIEGAKGNPDKIEAVNLEYIEYFRNVPNLVVVKENAKGILELKISK